MLQNSQGSSSRWGRGVGKAAGLLWGWAAKGSSCTAVTVPGKGTARHYGFSHQCGIPTQAGIFCKTLFSKIGAIKNCKAHTHIYIYICRSLHTHTSVYVCIRKTVFLFSFATAHRAASADPFLLLFPLPPALRSRSSARIRRARLPGGAPRPLHPPVPPQSREILFETEAGGRSSAQARPGRDAADAAHVLAARRLPPRSAAARPLDFAPSGPQTALQLLLSRLQRSLQRPLQRPLRHLGRPRLLAAEEAPPEAVG